MLLLCTVLLFCIFCVALRINQIVVSNYEERIRRKQALQSINELIIENYMEAEKLQVEYDQLDDLTPQGDLPPDSNVISFLKEKNSRKYRK
tara:strand:- start:939 stop:1211 length:273 start_codon:yes stop_codon:yes gene_type:complete